MIENWKNNLNNGNKIGAIYGTKYSRMDQVKFEEDSRPYPF